MAKRKIILVARRHEGEKWTSWVSTDNETLLKHHVRAIRSYGWQYKLKQGKVKPS